MQRRTVIINNKGVPRLAGREAERDIHKQLCVALQSNGEIISPYDIAVFSVLHRRRCGIILSNTPAIRICNCCFFLLIYIFNADIIRLHPVVFPRHTVIYVAAPDGYVGASRL